MTRSHDCLPLFKLKLYLLYLIRMHRVVGNHTSELLSWDIFYAVRHEKDLETGFDMGERYVSPSNKGYNNRRLLFL